MDLLYGKVNKILTCVIIKASANNRCLDFLMHLHVTIVGRLKMNIREKLLELTEPSYGDFQARLVPIFQERT